MIFDTISVKVRWERWCRWNRALRVINARKTCIFCRTESVAMTLKIMCIYAHYVTLGSRCKMACWASYRFLPFIVVVFSWLALLFLELYCSFTMYDVSRCLTSPLILYLCGVVRERLLPCRVVTAKWVVTCTRITCIRPLSSYSLTCLACSFFSESVVVFLFLFSSSFPPCVLSFLSLAYWPFQVVPPLLACLIMASILHFSFRLHLFTSRCFVIGSPD